MNPQRTQAGVAVPAVWWGDDFPEESAGNKVLSLLLYLHPLLIP